MPPARKRGWIRKTLRFFAVVLFLYAAFLAVFFLKCTFTGPTYSPLPAANPAHAAITAEIGANRRPLEDEYYSYPEWYIVYSYVERADFLEHHLPSGFPHWREIAQYWRGYCFVSRITHARRQFNFGDHLMLVVLGTSFTLEYGIRSAYEDTIGRLSEWSSSGQPVEEDAYAARVARDYANFVYIRPFYEYYFARCLKGLWKETHFWGPHPVRKWERKAILSVDYGLEAIYAWVLEKASHITYGIESADTYAAVENVPEKFFQDFPQIRKVKELGQRSFIVVIPRYQEFTELAVQLAKREVHFLDIAGNEVIFVTAVVSKNSKFDSKDAQILFEVEFITHPGLKRVALESQVNSLHAVLNDLQGRGAQIEHVYDF
jgi:hypothetical protein